jgi:hypothetical protein
MKKISLLLLPLLFALTASSQTWYGVLGYPKSQLANGRIPQYNGTTWDLKDRSGLGLTVAHILGLQDSLNLKLSSASPFFSGTSKFGLNVTTTIPDGAGAAFTPMAVFAHAAKAGLAVYSNDGVNNRRLGLFSDETAGFVGLSQGTAGTSLPFVYRNSGGERFRINADGTVRLNVYTTAGVLATNATGDLSVSTSLPASFVGLGLVENTALSTWAGSTNLTTIGTLPSLNVTAGGIFGNGIMTSGSGTITNSNFYTGGTTTITSSNANLQFLGATNTSFRILERGFSVPNIPAGDNMFGHIIGKQEVNAAASGVHRIMGQFGIASGQVNSGAGSMQDWATMYIEGAGTGTETPTGRNDAFRVNSGNTYLGGQVHIPTVGTTATAPDSVLTRDANMNLVMAPKPASASNWTMAVLGTDQSTSTTASTWTSMGLSFPVTAGKTYKFKFDIVFDIAATTTGTRWAITGPAFTLMHYQSEAWQALNTRFFNHYNTYDGGSHSNATPRTTDNRAVVEGTIRPSASGNVTLRASSNVASSVATAKGGYTTVEWIQID